MAQWVPAQKTSNGITQPTVPCSVINWVVKPHQAPSTGWDNHPLRLTSWMTTEFTINITLTCQLLCFLSFFSPGNQLTCKLVLKSKNGEHQVIQGLCFGIFDASNWIQFYLSGWFVTEVGSENKTEFEILRSGIWLQLFHLLIIPWNKLQCFKILISWNGEISINFIRSSCKVIYDIFEKRLICYKKYINAFGFIIVTRRNNWSILFPYTYLQIF